MVAEMLKYHSSSAVVIMRSDLNLQSSLNEEVAELVPVSDQPAYMVSTSIVVLGSLGGSLYKAYKV
jgi:hypothetical protein